MSIVWSRVVTPKGLLYTIWMRFKVFMPIIFVIVFMGSFSFVNWFGDSQSPQSSPVQPSVEQGLQANISEGIAFIKARQWGEANRVFTEASKKFPGQFLPWWYMAMTSSSHRNYHRAILALQKAVKIQPDDHKSQFVLGLYLAASGDTEKVQSHLTQLKEINVTLSERLSKSITQAQKNFEKKVKVKLDGEFAEESVFVILGAALGEGCRMPMSLLRRLKKGLELAKKFPKTSLIVTGGDPALRGCKEAEKMSAWLVRKGIEKDRIVEEPNALDTFGNAKHSLKIVKNKSFSKVIVVTDYFHIPRARHLFELLGKGLTIEAVAAKSKSPEDDKKRIEQNFSIYRDTARALGYWMRH